MWQYFVALDEPEGLKKQTKTERTQAHPNSTEPQSPNGVQALTFFLKKLPR